MPLQYINPGVAFGGAVVANQEKRRQLEAAQAALEREIQQEQFENSIKSRSASVNEGNLGVNQGRLTEDVRQFDAQAPTRSANVGHTTAQTAALNQDTGFKAENRAGTFRFINQLSDQSPGSGRPSPRTLANLNFMGGVDFATPAGERALVGAENLGRETGASEGAAWNAGGRSVFGEQERIRGDQDVRVANARQAAASQATPQELDGVASMVISDPDVLKALDVKTRTELITHMANAPSGSVLAAKKNDVTNRMKTEALALAKDLLGDGTLPYAVGAQGPGTLFGMKDEPLPGTPQSSFRSKLASLKAKLVMPNMRFMSGLGALSDTEGQRIADATTALSHRMDEGTFKRELASIISRLEQASPGQALGGGEDIRTLRDGRRVRVTKAYPDGSFDAVPVP